MTRDSILSPLLAAAAFLKHPFQDVAGQSIKDAYAAAKSYLQKKLGANADAARALEMATAKPESLLRKAQLAEETASCDLERDAELVRLIEVLASALTSSTATVRQIVRVGGVDNRVQVAGRDLVLTERVVRRNAITPDERHITADQRDRLRAVIGELAARLVGSQGHGGISAIHGMLQRRFKVASYLLLERGRFVEAMDFLKEQRVIHRARLQRSDPVAYRNDLYRAIFAGARELGWEGGQVYRCATERLGLKCPVASLKELGPVQLKSLAQFIQREVRSLRENAGRVDVAVAK